MELLNSLWKLFLALINPLFSIPAAIVIGIFVWKNREYKQGAYYQITKLPYFSMCRDAGRYGEYLIYKCLKSFEQEGARFLFNIYIPKSNGQTTEIDVLMLCPQGIFVFESKNYSGWIFGSGNQKNWYQTLPAGRRKSHKESFYNPIMQNRSHINHMQKYLGDQIPAFSIIVFSDRCELRNVRFDPKEAIVAKRWHIQSTVSAICHQVPPELISKSKLEEIYNKLYPLTQVDANTKKQHIEAILHNNTPHVAPPPPQSPPSTAVAAEESNNPNVLCLDPQEESTKPDPTTSSPEPICELQNTNCVSVEPQPDICPSCGGTLVLRTATRGANAGNQFFGCSNYPKCRYIRNIDNKTV